MPATSFAVGQVKRSGVWDGSGVGVRVASGVAAAGTCSGDATTVARFVAPGSRKVDFIVKGVCSALEATARHSEKYASSVSGFQRSSHFPNLVSIAERILENGLCSKESFVISHIYSQRLIKKRTAYVLNSQSVLAFFLASLVVAAKFLDDFYCRNAYFAAVGDMPLQQLNELELRLCFLLDFDLNVSKEEFGTTWSRLSLDTCLQASPSTWLVSAESVKQNVLKWPSKPIESSSYGVPLHSPIRPAANTTLDTCGWPSLPSISLCTARYTDAALPWDPATIWQPGEAQARSSLPCRDPLGAAAAWFSSVPHCSPA